MKKINNRKLFLFKIMIEYFCCDKFNDWDQIQA